MTIEAHLVLAAVFGPLAQAALVAFAPRRLRGGLHAAASAAIAAIVLVALARALGGAAPASLTLAQPAPGAALSFVAEPLGLAFAAVASVSGALIGMHAAAYVRAQREPAPARMLAAMAALVGGANALALSGGLFAFALALAWIAIAGAALIGVRDDAPSRKAASLHLTVLLATSLGLILPAAGWVHAIAGDVGFASGGVLAGRLAPGYADGLLFLFALGLGHAGLLALHRPVTEAAVAPAPALALILAASAGAAAFGLLKVTLFTFGPAIAEARFARTVLSILAYACAALCSALALARPDLKGRLAYAGAAQLALAFAGALAASAAAAFGAALQIAAASLACATLVMAAGAVEVATGRAAAHEMTGLGRTMPTTFAAFTIGAIGLSGAPPLAGAWSRLWLAAGAGEAGAVLAALVIAASGALAFAAFAPLAVRATFGPRRSLVTFKPDAGSPALIAPIGFGAALLVGLVLLVEPLARAFGPVLESAR